MDGGCIGEETEDRLPYFADVGSTSYCVADSRLFHDAEGNSADL